MTGGVEEQEGGGGRGGRFSMVQGTGTLRKAGRGGWVLAGILSEKSS